MFFSRTKKKLCQGICIVLVTVWCIVYLLNSLPWMQKRECRNTGRLSSFVLCQLNTSQPYPSLFYQLGGNGPWIPRASASGIAVELPASCFVQQAHILLRHAERYPTKNAGARHVVLLQRLQDPQLALGGSLSFLRNWAYFTDLDTPAFENLTMFGPYAGTLQAHKTGLKLKQRYAHLLPSDTAARFWACSSPRDIETAKHFAAGFFGHDWHTNGRVKLHIIPESADRGADTLTPGDTCSAYIQDKDEGHDLEYTKLAQWQKVFSANISSRLRDDVGGLQLNPRDIYSMMEMCGFEILARGSSPWCAVFSQQEWSQFEYARDLLHFYRAGPGNRYAGAMGQLWLDATYRVMARDISQGVYLSFVHDSDIIAVVAALGILDEVGIEQSLPADRVKEARRWKTSDIVPMGGYIVLEKVYCGKDITRGDPGRYVRLIINDGLFDLGSAIVESRVDGATMLGQFGAYIQQRGKQSGSFIEVCGLSQHARPSITFLEQ